MPKPEKDKSLLHLAPHIQDEIQKAQTNQQLDSLSINVIDLPPYWYGDHADLLQPDTIGELK